MTVAHSGAENWVRQIASVTLPDTIYWCDGSEAERLRMLVQMEAAGTAQPLDPIKRPCFPMHYRAAMASSRLAKRISTRIPTRQRRPATLTRSTPRP